MNMPRTIHIPNGENIVHTFSDEEYQNRQRKLRAHMAKNNIDNILIIVTWDCLQNREYAMT